MSLTSVDLPDPETPVTAVRQPSGKRAVTFCRLFARAPTTVIAFPLPARRWAGTGIVSSRERYFPVSDRGKRASSSAVPSPTTSPPWTPAPGPRSTTRSAARIVSSSCSTTTTVFPRSRIAISVSISFRLSFG
jgi:hypothetical protein